MYLTTEIKKEIFKKHGKSESDTGTSEGQIALFSHRISEVVVSEESRGNKSKKIFQFNYTALHSLRRIFCSVTSMNIAVRSSLPISIFLYCRKKLKK